MPRLYLGLAIHNHQPVGNFDWVFQEAYDRAYLPFVELLERHPSVRLSLHYTGPLLDWLRANHPGFLARVAVLVARGQVELMTGGYYEPILAAIPDADKVGQILKLTQTLRDELGAEPTGLWLAERVWEPHLPKPLREAGVSWTVVDDSHFKMVGLQDEDLFGYYLTEEQGFPLKLFASSQVLRYTIPWRTVEEAVEYLRGEAVAHDGKIAVMGDDGEKFGVWPGTYETCWEQGWMERFFEALERESDWLTTVPLGEYARQFPPLGRVYLPTASYAEMMEWALPADLSHQYHKLVDELQQQERFDVLRFLRGGFWRNFLVKYPEVNAMHKKMLRVHDKVYRARAQGADGGLEALWAGQCNCPYWHGVFGGVYIADIRATTYRNLVAAETQADAALHPAGQPWLEPTVGDLDYDGKEELLVETSRQNLLVVPAVGGSLRAWEWRVRPFNLLSTMTRRPEAYHRAIEEGLVRGAAKPPPGDGSAEAANIHETVRAKQEGLEAYLTYDWYPRVALLDHFLHPDTSLDAFARASYGEQGDFVDQPYSVRLERAADDLVVDLVRDGHVWVDQRRAPVRLAKRLVVGPADDRVDVEIVVTNLGDRLVHLRYGSEWNLNLLGGGRNPLAYYRVPDRALEDERLDSRGVLVDVAEVAAGNRGLGIEVRARLGQPATLWRFPVETVSSSEGGLERVYQGSCLLFQWPLVLPPGASWHVRLSWELHAL
ncbi:MAG TPA: alpha-amylase/4-alpha-glucanotransferase domain-containing protein [Chloroflexota bacterium]